MLNQSLKSLGEYAEVVVDLKRRGASLADVQAACCGGSVHLLRSREESRQAAIEAERSKDKTSEQRDKLDHDSLQLHNLVYEQQYYDKEVAGCINFQSSVPDEKLSCISPEQFLQQTGSAVAALSAHDRELARLTHELQQRKRLKADLQALQQRKQQALAELNAATARIDDLRSHMEAISQSSKQLMETSLPATSAIKNNKDAAELLPLPLYIIYSQAVAGSSVLGLPLLVDIDGSTAAAARFAADTTGQGAGTTEAAAAAATAATPSQPSKRRRKSDHQQEDQTYKVHPLSVTIIVQSTDQVGPEQQPLMQLTFQYYPQLQLVGVSAASPEAEEVLTDLFLGDAGDGQLLENVAALANSGMAVHFGEPGRPRPFRWAQDLAGVDVVSSLPSSYSGVDRQQLLSALSAYRSQLRLEALVERITAAVQGRRAMKTILEKLSHKEQPPSSLDAKILTKVNTNIHNWRHISDTGMAVKQLEQPVAADQLIARHTIQGWQQQAAAGSTQEEGEVGAAVGDGAEATSNLQNVDTAGEDLLQGLLVDDSNVGAETAAMAAAKAAAARSARAVRIAEDVEAAAAEGERYGEGVHQQDYREDEPYLEPSQASEGSDAAGVDDTAAAAAADLAASNGSRTSVCAVMARYGLYRLVLRSPNMEAHFHVKVFLNYPLCPPVFAVTKLLDTKSKSVGPLQTVNEVLALEQQANSAALTAVADASEVLAVQVLHLRQYLDLLSSQLRSEASSKDLIDKLRARQQLRGRDRQPRPLMCG